MSISLVYVDRMIFHVICALMYWSYFKQVILAAMNSSIPKITIKPNQYPK